MKESEPTDPTHSLEDSSPRIEVENEREAAGETVRVGSPFAEGTAKAPPPLAAAPSGETFYDVGPMRYTAMGAVSAAIMVVFFAAMAAWWFPSGGTLIAGLGCVLAIMGMFSHFRNLSVGLLVVHVVFFLTCYSRALE
ncbi:hypothetical protein N9N28_00045 [Rubripirellula amarantea]|nr:hypothetical protein [Rubripirellula amarantea]MDA8742994.1 hypothetical protein [Rubripirellula amarantea]